MSTVVRTLAVAAVGEVAMGRETVMEALAPYFEAKTARWSWTEVARSRAGLPHRGHHLPHPHRTPRTDRHAINTVTYTFERGRWLVISDQGTAVDPAPAQ